VDVDSVVDVSKVYAAYIFMVDPGRGIYTQYIQGFCHSRFSTADHVLFVVAFAYEF
jgi:hypothetical protein